MKAWVLEHIKRPLVFKTLPEKDPPQGEVVVDLVAASLNRRDYWITQGLYPGIEPPTVLGSDGAGVVSRVGPGVEAEWVGREVMINPGFEWGANPSAQSGDFHILGSPRDGTLATSIIVPATSLFEKPSTLDWHQAASIPLAGVTAFRAVFTRGCLKPGQTILIHGIGGGVATFALQFAVAAGANVWVTSSSQAKIDRAVELGAQGGFLYTDPEWIRQIPTSQTPHLIVDGAGGPGYPDLLKLIRPGGSIVNYGATAGAPPKFDLFKLFWKQINLLGTTMGSPADFAEMMRFIEQHQITPVIDSLLPLSDGNQAVEQMGHSPQFGKYVLTIS